MGEIIQIINPETGEVLEEYDSTDVRIISKVQAKTCRETNGGETVRKREKGESIELTNNAFVKMNYKEQREVYPELNAYEVKMLATLVNYIEYWSNCVVINGNYTPTIQDLSELSGMSRAKAADTLASLVKKHLIAKVYTGKDRKHLQYYVNPWIALKGRYIDATLKTMFREYPIRSKGMKKWKEL